MKVIVNKHLPQNVKFPYLFTCQECGSVLEAEAGDVHHRVTEGAPSEHRVACLLCGKYHYIR